MEISLGILQGDHDPKNGKDESMTIARTFAIRTIKDLSGTTLRENESKVWDGGAQRPFREPATITANQIELSNAAEPIAVLGISPMVVNFSECIAKVTKIGGDQDSAVRI